MVDIEHIGPDKSTGSEIHGVSIDVEEDILKILCPKNTTLEVQQELMETAIDVAALPGKLQSLESGNAMNQLAEVVSELSGMQAARNGRQPRDTQWRLTTRNALERIKSLEDLITSADEISQQKTKVLGNMDSGMGAILRGEGWAVDDAKLYSQASLLPWVVRDTLSLYYDLLLFLRTVSSSTNNADTWDLTDKEYVQHHADKLCTIRMYANKRSQVVLQTYTYLRDSKNLDKFTSPQLLTTLTRRLQDIYTAQRPTPAPGPQKGSLFGCGHCHGDFHKGGRKDCPLHTLKINRARKLGPEIDKKSDEDHLDKAGLEALIQEVLAREV